MSVSIGREDSRVVIIEDDFSAFRDEDGVWMSKAPYPIYGADLADDFRRVTDAAEASTLISAARTSLSL